MRPREVAGVVDTGVQTAFTVTQTVQDVQEAMAAINGRIRESEAPQDTDFLRLLVGNNGMENMAPLGTINVTTDNQTESVEVQSQDLEGEVNAAGDLPMVSRNVKQRLDDLVQVLQEQCEAEKLETAVKELDRAMERLIFRLASGNDDSIQQSESVKAMQDSVYALLSSTVEGTLRDPIPPSIPDKSLLGQIADMLQIISSVVKAHYMYQHLQISAIPIEPEQPADTRASWSSVSSTAPQRQPHRTTKLLSLQIGTETDTLRSRTALQLTASGSTVSGLSVMFIEGSQRSVIPLKLPDRGMNSQNPSTVFQVDNALPPNAMVNIRLSSGFNMTENLPRSNKASYEAQTSGSFLPKRSVSAQDTTKVDGATETFLRKPPIVDEATAIDSTTVFRKSSLSRKSKERFSNEHIHAKSEVREIKEPKIEATETGKSRKEVLGPCFCDDADASQAASICEPSCSVIDSIPTQTDGSSIDGSQDIVRECIERATRRQRMGSFHKTLSDLEYDLKSMGRLISDSYHVMSHGPRVRPPMEESVLTDNYDFKIATPRSGAGRCSLSAEPSVDRRVPGVYEPSTRRRLPSNNLDRNCKSPMTNSALEHHAPAYTMDPSHAQQNFLEHCVRHFKERGISESGSGVPWTPSLPALNATLPTAQRSLAPPFVTSPDDFFTK